MEVVTEGKLERQIRYELVSLKNRTRGRKKETETEKKTLRKRGGTKDRRLFFINVLLTFMLYWMILPTSNERDH